MKVDFTDKEMMVQYFLEFAEGINYLVIITNLTTKTNSLEFLYLMPTPSQGKRDLSATLQSKQTF